MTLPRCRFLRFTLLLVVVLVLFTRSSSRGRFRRERAPVVLPRGFDRCDHLFFLVPLVVARRAPDCHGRIPSSSSDIVSLSVPVSPRTRRPSELGFEEITRPCRGGRIVNPRSPLFPDSTVPFSGAPAGRAVEVVRAQVADVDAEVAFEKLRTRLEPGREDLSARARRRRQGRRRGREETRKLRLQRRVVRPFESGLNDRTRSGTGERTRSCQLSFIFSPRGTARPMRQRGESKKGNKVKICPHSLTVLLTAPRAAPKNPHPLPSAPTGSSLKSSNPGRALELKAPTPPDPDDDDDGFDDCEPKPEYRPPCDGGKSAER